MRSARGFTLIELLIAISILAVLSVIGLVVFSGVQAKARDGKRVNDLQQIQVALEQYYQDNGFYPAALPAAGSPLTLGTKTYLAQMPADPKNSTPFVYIYTALRNGNTGCTNDSGDLCTSYTLTDNSETNPTVAFIGTQDSIVAMIVSGGGGGSVPTPAGGSTPGPTATVAPTATPVPAVPTPTVAPTANCAPGNSLDQVWPGNNMLTCKGSSPSFSNASCGSGSHVCSAYDYLARGGSSYQPYHSSWLSTRVSTPTTGTCSSSLCGGSTCDFLQPGTNYYMITHGAKRALVTSSCSDITANTVGYFYAVLDSNFTSYVTCCSN